MDVHISYKTRDSLLQKAKPNDKRRSRIIAPSLTQGKAAGFVRMAWNPSVLLASKQELP